MNRYYRLSPEVPGGFGSRSRVDWTHRPPIVHRVHMEFDGWLGDDLVTAYPVFLVTQRAAEALASLRPSGCELEDVEVTPTEQFEFFYPGRTLPLFRWLRIHGRPGQEDVGLTEDARLVVSARVLECLRRLSLQHCEVQPLSEPSGN